MMSVRSPHPSLRPWRDADFEAFAALHADPEVAYWLGGTLTREQSRRLFDDTRESLERQGWGVWALQDEAGQLVGATGLQPVPASLPVRTGIEATWRLLPRAWGRGLVTTALRAVLADARERLGCREIVSYTAEPNARSRAVMARLGFTYEADRDFDHPRLAADHPLRRHVFYRLELR
ncbi:MAG: GNAT family N-acetyltransferase [Steroidobacteraceae bacterium]